DPASGPALEPGYRKTAICLLVPSRATPLGSKAAEPPSAGLPAGAINRAGARLTREGVLRATRREPRPVPERDPRFGDDTWPRSVRAWPARIAVGSRRPRATACCGGAGRAAARPRKEAALACRLDARRPGLRRATVVEVQHPAQPLSTQHRAIAVRGLGRPDDQPIVESLMVALDVVVRRELRYRPSQVAFAEGMVFHKHRLDRQHEPLRVRIQVGTSRGQLEALDARSPQQGVELPREQRVAIVDQVAHPAEGPVDRIPEIARHLLHPASVRLAGDAGD